MLITGWRAGGLAGWPVGGWLWHLRWAQAHFLGVQSLGVGVGVGVGVVVARVCAVCGERIA